jgi:hypothetical protein
MTMETKAVGTKSRYMFDIYIYTLLKEGMTYASFSKRKKS